MSISTLPPQSVKTPSLAQVFHMTDAEARILTNLIANGYDRFDMKSMAIYHFC